MPYAPQLILLQVPLTMALLPRPEITFVLIFQIELLPRILCYILLHVSLYM